jgi:serine protease AprX
MKPTDQVVCPLCQDKVDRLLYRWHIDSERTIIGKIKAQHPGWTESDGLCARCVDYYQVAIVREQRILPDIGPHFPIKSADDFIILPTGLRLDADTRFTGKGVVICFIDSGFCLHPDLVATRNRVMAMVDVTGGTPTNNGGAWHGTMTSVVCAGDGYLSKGLYRGIASDAELVLIKVLDNAGRITTENIVKALEWVLENHDRLTIRIVNLSLGGDEAGSYTTSRVDQLAEALVAAGILVVAAVGNDEYGVIRPPANALNVIAVGGIDDGNTLEPGKIKAYHSSYGRTEDALMKPELVAHAIWIAAPILPGSQENEEARALYASAKKAVSSMEESIRQRIRATKYISGDYMHVDGTSFSAPIVCSVAAQLLEANPSLSPYHIRQILFNTAQRIPGMPAERQGFGIVQPRKAILKVLKKEIFIKMPESPFIDQQRRTITFFVEHDCAGQVSLTGSFNHWAEDVLLLEPGKHGIWKIEIPLLPAGKYPYKFLAEGTRWLEDVDNPLREPDGFGGFNSILIISN